jgi:DNA-binding response OmpR family regulator/predicted Ser/Thr protein kinase
MARQTDATLLNVDDDRRRIAIVLYPLRRSAHRIAADCERLLELLQRPGRDKWRDAAGTALLASRELLSVVAQAGAAADVAKLTQRLTTLGSRIRAPQDRIADALAVLLTLPPDSPEDELLLEDARAVRDVAIHLQVATGRPATPSAGPHAATPLATATVAPRGRARVMVTDDQHSVRELLRRSLESLDCDVLLAENGREGLETALRDLPDLILTDMQMPELDGMGMLKALKATDRTKDIPVIVISSLGDEEGVVECIEAGAEDYIAKPFRLALLSARVRASIERKRMRDIERDYIGRVGDLTSAAEAVERGRYVAGSLDVQSAHADALGRLARVFDRMVTGLKSREDRLQRRLAQLRQDIGAASGRPKQPDAISGEESPFATGEILAARYEILGTLGKGGMGMVYRARDLELKDEVAIKVVRRDLIKEDPTVVERLKSEIRLARKISHKNVVRVHDIGEWKGAHFITMEMVRGITVADLLDRRGRLSVESTVAIGAQLADALAVAHEQQIIHRDIKPANLLVDEGGMLKVMDFGIARSVEQEKSITLSGFIVGTPEYMAPEQLMGGAVDVRSDLFAVGVVLYECLAGRPPYVADSPTALLARMLEAEPTPLRDLVQGIPAPLEELIYQQLRFQAKDRIASARELAEKLHETEQLHAPAANPLLDDIDIEIIEL